MEAWLPSTQPNNPNSTPTQVLASQSSVDIENKELSTQTSTAVSGIVTGSNTSNKFNINSISGINGNIVNAGRLTVENAFSGLVNSNNGAAQLRSAIQSISGVFSKASNELASGIDKALSGIFKDTNVKTSSTVPTRISDPIKTNLLNSKSPISTAFKISSLESGSSASTNSSLSSVFGSNSANMVGTEITTLLNRFNIDSQDNLISKISNSAEGQAVRGLLSDVSGVTRDITNLTNNVRNATNVVLRSTATAVQGVTNSLQGFLGRTNSLSNLTGMNMSQFFVADPNNTLRNSQGNAINTRGSGVDSGVANDLLNLARTINCGVPTDFYDSLTEIDSLFRSLLAMATNFRLDDLLDNLLACNRVNSQIGQDTLVYVFEEFATEDPTSANKILTNIENKSLLSTDKIYKDIVTNPNLSTSDVGTINSIITNLGTTVQKSYTIPGISADVDVYDINALSKSNKGFVDNVFGDSTLSTITSGTSAEFSTEGYLVWT